MGSSSGAFPGKDFNLRLETVVSGTTVYYSVYIDRSGGTSQTWSNEGTSSWEVTVNGSSIAKMSGLNYDFRGTAPTFTIYSGSFTWGSGSATVAAFATYDQLGHTNTAHAVSVVTVPGPPSPVAGTPSNITSSSMRYQFTAGSTGGSGFLEHQTQRATNTAFTSGLQTVSSNGTYDFTGLAAVTTYYFRSRSRNAVGWGSWSVTSSAKTLANIPSTPATPTASSVTPTSMKLSWSIPANGGSAINQMKLRRSNTANFASFVDYDLGAAVTSHTPTGLSPNTTYYWRVYARNAIGYSAASGTRTQATTPALPVAPSALAVTRVSDTSQTVAWTRNASTAAPYTSQQVQRREYPSTAWVGVANFGAYTNVAGQSWGDTGTVANKAYKYRVKAANGTGESYSAESPWIYTTPGTPSALAAVKQSSGDIVLTVTQTVSHNSYKTEIQYKVGAGAWTALTTLNSGVTSYTWTPPAGSSVQFQARVIVNDAGGVGNGLLSGYRASNVVPLLSAPNPPSALAPNGLAFDAAGARTFSWQHNTVDSSAQSAYELQWRIGTGAWTSLGKSTSTAQQRTISEGYFTNGNIYQWQVRTWGAFTDPSAWSTAATFTASASPSVAITNPTAVLEASLVTLEWTFSDPEGTAQSLWSAELLFDGNIIEQHSGSGATTSVPFTTRLTDGTEYQVRVQARDGSLLWSEWDQVSFTTDFPLPPAPSLEAYWEPASGSVSLTVANTDGVFPVEFNQILRSLDGGATWEHVLDFLPNSSGFDATVPLGVADVQYKAIAWTGLPSSSESGIMSVSTIATCGYWSAGPAFEQVMQLRVNMGAPPKIDLTTGLAQKTLHYFAGRKSPVEMVGEATQRVGAVEFAVTSVQDMMHVRAMALLVAPHLFRLPDGTFLYASIGPVSDTRLDQGWYHITLQVTEVER